jgi:hypothetical protein
VALGEDGWPEFHIPDVGQEGAPQASGAGTVDEPKPPVEPGKEPVGTKAPEGTPTPDEMIPKYRYDDLAKEVERQRQMTERLLAALEATKAQPAAPKPVEADPDAERKQKLVEELAALDPRIARMLELGGSADKILAAIERMNTFAEERESEAKLKQVEYDGYAKTVLTSIHDSYAKMLSDGKKLGKDLPEETRQTLTDNFIAWVMKDATRGRELRYNSKDPTLQTEFLDTWKRTWVEPWRRQQTAEDVRAAKRVQNLPVGGGTASPLGTPPPKPKADDDEDAVFHRGWVQTQELKEQLGSS